MARGQLTRRLLQLPSRSCTEPLSSRTTSSSTTDVYLLPQLAATSPVLHEAAKCQSMLRSTAKYKEDVVQNRRPLSISVSWLPSMSNSCTCRTSPAIARRPWATNQPWSCRSFGSSTTVATTSSSGSGSGSGASHTATDMIHIRGAKFYGYHGVLPEENKLGQPFVVDASLTCDLWQAGQSDDLQHTVNYAEVHRIVERVMQGPPMQLLEAVADQICRRIMQGHAQVGAVRLHIRKLCVPALTAAVESVGVEIVRTRSHYGL